MRYGRQHWIYKRFLQNDGKWVYTGRVSCHCHISENHWVLVPNEEEVAAS